MTLGRHLDNDLLLAGEDVLDYHLRLELTDRGPWAVPLGEASLRVNGLERGEPLGLVPGDALEIGQNVLEVVVEPRQAGEADGWLLCAEDAAAGGDGVVAVDGRLSIGRGDDNDLQLADGHVSRRHARLEVHHGVAWVRDLNSANGTQVNGQRLAGGCRLFHGDEIRFDAVAYQLVGRGAELTPVRAVQRGDGVSALRISDADAPDASTDTTEVAPADEPPAVEPALPPAGESGLFLLGASDTIARLVYRTPMGKVALGRDEGCDLVLRERTVSRRHAELTVRAEGVTVTNLMATNGTRLNGRLVQTSRLHDGDELLLGRVRLVFRELAPPQSPPWWRRLDPRSWWRQLRRWLASR
ncbi:MAG: FHA domain-containing protein [Pseudomonadota bacterium]